MKTESEIRRHRDNLLRSAEVPCTCPTIAGRLLCEAVKSGLRNHAALLSWALGEEPRLDAVVKELDEGLAVEACPHN